MKIIDITHKLPFKRSNGTMNKKFMDTIVVHHDGVNRPLAYDSVKRYIGEANYHISKGWGHISYHYAIDNIGDIYKCLPETEIAYHSGVFDINKKSLAIKFDGNMEQQQLTWQQKKAYAELVDYLCTKRPDLPKIVKKSIKMHREIKKTACPGRNSMRVVIENR